MQRGSHYCRGTYGDLACFLRRREVSISTGLEDNSIRTRSSGKGSSRELSGTLRGHTLPSQSDRRPNLPEKELSSICSRAPSVPGGYVCTPAHDSIIGPVCSIPAWCILQHCRSFPEHLLMGLGHHRGGFHSRGAFACPRGGKSLPEERSLPHSDP